MKATKLCLGILSLTSLMVISSCSDNSISPVNSETRENQFTSTGITERGDNYSATFKIAPGSHIYLHSGITFLEHITEYSISNCDLSSRDLHISASNIDGMHSLPCSSSSYFLDDLLIENRSNLTKSVQVSLTGISVK